MIQFLARRLSHPRARPSTCQSTQAEGPFATEAELRELIDLAEAWGSGAANRKLCLNCAYEALHKPK
jgi:hypothetical protein